MAERLPEVTRVYRNHHLDSKRWDVFSPREGDIVVTTAYKAGTTWTQQILSCLIHPERSPTEASAISPWIDAGFMGVSVEALAAQLDALPSPRFVKSHLPLDGLPYSPDVRYLVVARDPRDVFMSLLNHWENYGEPAYAALGSALWGGDPFPRFVDAPRELFRDWISRGWFPWESEGYPFWANLGHTQSYWEFRHLPNLLFLHYNDMLADLAGSVRRIADFCGLDASDEDVVRTVEATTFANVKKVARAQTQAQDGGGFFKGGADAFFFKGTNGRWRGLLTEADLALYESAKARVLTADCARWIEKGGPV